MLAGRLIAAVIRASLSAALTAVPVPARADGPSFNCGRAHGIVEQTICSKPSLSAADREVAAAYRAARSEPGIDQVAIRADQSHWLRSRNERCSPVRLSWPDDIAFSQGAPTWTELCLRSSYADRLAALRAPPLPSGSACRVIASHLPLPGSRVPAGMSPTEALTKMPGSVLTVGKGMGAFLSSHDRGTTGCQVNELRRSTPDGSVELPMPDRFRGGEGALCHGDSVRLAGLNGVPVLVEEDAGENGGSLDVSARAGGGWAPACRLELGTVPHYAIEEQFCSGDICPELERLAPELVDAQHSPAQGFATAKSREAGQPEFEAMRRMAVRQGLAEQDLPTLGEESQGRYAHSFWNHLYTMIPVAVDGHLLLGKLGSAGFGEHYGSAELLAIYRLVGAHLDPVAGFYLDVASRTLSGVHVTVPP